MKGTRVEIGGRHEIPIRRAVEQIMGMPVSLALRGAQADSDQGRRAWGSVVAELREVDRVFSTYRADSDVSRLGRGELALADCPPEVAQVIALGERAERESGGAFSLYLPGPDGQRRLDPSGVVKGWAVERASRYLAALDDTDFCLSAGGDLVGRVTDPDRPDWQVGIENPLDPAVVLAVLPVRSAAVATSGTAHRGDHLVDGRTGLPVTGVASVTVIGESLTWADIDATAAYGQGTEAVNWLRTRPGQSAFVVWSDGTTTIVDGRRRPPHAAGEPERRR